MNAQFKRVVLASALFMAFFIAGCATLPEIQRADDWLAQGEVDFVLKKEKERD